MRIMFVTGKIGQHKLPLESTKPCGDTVSEKQGIGRFRRQSFSWDPTEYHSYSFLLPIGPVSHRTGLCYISCFLSFIRQLLLCSISMPNAQYSSRRNAYVHTQDKGFHRGILQGSSYFIFNSTCPVLPTRLTLCFLLSPMSHQISATDFL